MNTAINNETQNDIREWQERVELLRTENNQMKYQLAKAILKNVSVTFLEASEDLYQILLDKDQAMDLIRHEIVTLLSVTVVGLDFHYQYAALRRDTERFERDFHALQVSFLKHLTH